MLKYLFNYVPAKVLPGLVNLISIMIYSRIFSQQDYGEFSYILAVGTLIQGVIFPWIRMSLSRFIHEYENKEEKEAFLSNIYNLNYWVTLFITILLSLLYLATNNFYFLLIIIIISTNALVEIIFAHLRSEFFVIRFSTFSIIRALAKLFFTISITVLASNGTLALVFGLVASNLLVILMLGKFIPKLNLKETIKKKGSIKQFLEYGLPLTFTFLMAIILSSIDRIFIKNLLGLTEVAEYTLAYDFSSFITTNIIMIINLAYYPIVMRSYSRSLNYQERLLEFNKLIFLISSALLIILISNSRFISEIIFGSQYNANTMSYIIILVSISAFISGLKSFYYDIVFHISKNTKLQIIPIAVAAILNIILNWIFIPVFGLNGALYSTLLSYLLALFLSVLIGKKVLKIPLLNKTSLICLFLIIVLSTLFNMIFNNDPLIKFIFTISIVLVIYISYIFTFEKQLLHRLIKGEILDE